MNSSRSCFLVRLNRLSGWLQLIKKLFYELLVCDFRSEPQIFFFLNSFCSMKFPKIETFLTGF